MRDQIRFLMGGEIREIRHISPTETVLSWLRTDAARLGTKEGCGEGDCGACSVLIGELVGGKLRYSALNACIQFMPTLDGKHLVTVEDLKTDDGNLHAVQQALVEEHGSQCGFCTPGFAISLYGFYLNNENPTVPNLNDALAGNLCRCTGYGSIVKSGQRMFDIDCDDPIRKREQEIIATLTELNDGDTLAMNVNGQRFMVPRTADEFAALYDAYPDATILAGGTDVGLWVTKQNRRLENLIYLGNVSDLKRIDETDTAITVWANATQTESMPVLSKHYPEFGELLRRFGAVQVRNAGTMCGNVANGSPIGDCPPVLIALGAELTLRRGQSRRQLHVEDFYIEYGVQDRKPGEFVESITIPTPQDGWQLFAFKISKRFDQDISALCGAFNIKLVDGAVIDIRIAFGGMAATPKRAAGAEKALIGRSWTETTLALGMEALRADYTPLTDMRASAEYRSKTSANLLRKVFLETTGATTAPRITSSMETASDC